MLIVKGEMFPPCGMRFSRFTFHVSRLYAT